MDQKMEVEIKKILDGEILDEEIICDFSLEDQKRAMEAQGIESTINYERPKIGANLTYVVAAVIFNDDDEVLMIQEAKPSCKGKWYLPAGRLNSGETIQAACKRECKEETGLEIELLTLLMIESAKGIWFRFVLTGRVSGGKLKGLQEADEESLQAKWIKSVDDVELRAGDVCGLIERGREYWKARREHATAPNLAWHPDRLPLLRPHKRLLLRLLIAVRSEHANGSSGVQLVVGRREKQHLPLCEIHPHKSLHSTLRRFMVEVFGADVPPHRPHGVLTLEFAPEFTTPATTADGLRNSAEGFCVTLLVAFKTRKLSSLAPILGKFQWQEISPTLARTITERIAGKNSTLGLNVIS